MNSKLLVCMKFEEKCEKTEIMEGQFVDAISVLLFVCV